MATTTDLLGDIFETLRLEATIYFRTDYSPPWALTVPAHDQAARFHLVSQGRCHVELPSGQSVTLSAGDLVIIPRGQEHVLSDRPGRRPAPLERLLKESRYDGRGVFILGSRNRSAATQMLCGHFAFAKGADHPLLRVLPDMLVMTSDERAKHPLLRDTLHLVLRTAFGSEVSSSAVLRRLAEIFFVETIRTGLGQSAELARLLGGLKDEGIGRALLLIHQQPAKPWTVATLARQVHMSRSRFAERFRMAMDQSPMTYIAEWRLQRALALLANQGVNVAEIADRVGYRSTTAFSRAFKNRFGRAPSAFRRAG